MPIIGRLLIGLGLPWFVAWASHALVLADGDDHTRPPARLSRHARTGRTARWTDEGERTTDTLSYFFGSAFQLLRWSWWPGWWWPSYDRRSSPWSCGLPVVRQMRSRS